MTGNQAVQQVRAGLKAIYLSGWQVAGDANLAAQTYPDQSLYPANSVPAVVRRINNALIRADQISWSEGVDDGHRLVRADRRRRRGRLRRRAQRLRADEGDDPGRRGRRALGRPAVLGEEVRPPRRQGADPDQPARQDAERRPARGGRRGRADLIVARTDAQAATLITSDVDERDRQFITGDRTAEGFYRVTNGIDPCISRGLAYAPYADLLWMETSKPDLELARQYAEAIKKEFPDQLLAYNCSPSFNWKQHLDDDTIAKFQRELGAMGYKFQFITLAGFHALNYAMFELAKGYSSATCPRTSSCRRRSSRRRPIGYTATKHQREVGAGYFDAVATAIDPEAETLALKGSTEEEQFH